MKRSLHVGTISVPYDSGHYRKRMGLGPEILFRECLEPLFLKRGINYRHEEIISNQSHSAEISSAFELCATVSHRVQALRAADYFPILLSGNCGIAIGGISGCGAADTSVAWFDAHGEANTPETTNSGFLDGMGIAILTGQCWRTLASQIPGFHALPGDRVLLIGSRDVEHQERRLLDQVGVRRIQSVSEVSAVASSLSQEINGCYFHFDLDVLDPKEAVVNQWAPPGGMMLEEALQVVDSISAQLPVKGFGFGSYDPTVDGSGRGLKAATAIMELLLANKRGKS